MAGSSHDDVLFDLTIAAENALYKTHLESGRETDIMGPRRARGWSR
jgi:hypothetical protein